MHQGEILRVAVLMVLVVGPLLLGLAVLLTSKSVSNCAVRSIIR
jgi:hypothetical protein